MEDEAILAGVADITGEKIDVPEDASMAQKLRCGLELLQKWSDLNQNDDNTIVALELALAAKDSTQQAEIRSVGSETRLGASRVGVLSRWLPQLVPADHCWHLLS